MKNLFTVFPLSLVWCSSCQHPSASQGWQVQSPLSQVRDRVTSHLHPEAFLEKTVMPVVRFLPTHSWVPKAIFIILSHLLPLPLASSASGRATQCQSCASSGTFPSPWPLSSSLCPLGMGHLWSWGCPAQPTARTILRYYSAGSAQSPWASSDGKNQIYYTFIDYIINVTGSAGQRIRTVKIIGRNKHIWTYFKSGRETEASLQFIKAYRKQRMKIQFYLLFFFFNKLRCFWQCRAKSKAFCFHLLDCCFSWNCLFNTQEGLRDYKN